MSANPQLFSLTVPAIPERLTLIRALLRRSLEAAGCEEELTSRLVIAINEACMNIIQHAYSGSGNGDFTLRLEQHGAELVFRLEDAAPPVDPATVQGRSLEDIRPGGLGVHFIREIMDTVDRGHLPLGSGNYLEMRKIIE